MAAEEQFPLSFGPSPAFSDLRPAPGTAEPVIWVERLAVYRSWPPTEENLLRKIELRKGLNILWAETKAAASPEGRLSGHGAGKTTFCRLLRYALGDAKPGNQQFRTSFRKSFPRGWVLADVWVAGICWLVARPLGELGDHPWAVRDASLLDGMPDAPPRGAASFKDYEAALNEAVFSGLPERELSGSGTKLEWPLLLPWLSRDQEAHYASLSDWRVKESDSDSPGLTAPDRENLMRLVLGLVGDVEQKKQRIREEKTQEHERLVKDRSKKEYHFSVARDRLAELLKEPVGNPGELLFENAVNQRVADLHHQAHEAIKGLRDDAELTRLIGDESEVLSSVRAVEAQIEEVEGYVAQKEGTVKATVANAAKAQQSFATTKFLPFRGHCSTPLPIARSMGCPCITARPDDDEVQQATTAIASDASTQKTQLAALKKELDELNVELASRKKAHEAAQASTKAHREWLDNQIETLARPNQEAADLDAAFKAFLRAADTLSKLESDVATLASEKRVLDEELVKLSRQHRDAMDSFSQLFNLIVQAMLGPKVEGRVAFEGKSLDPRLEFHGSYDSAAPNLTKLLAFDIASLCISQFKGIGHHPRFLLHDSPRESDLAPEIYEALFQTAQALEAACGASPGFQYIITTTSAPPPELQDAPWLIQPKLDATQAELRFLGVDLG
jgi:hypothetical protein